MIPRIHRSTAAATIAAADAALRQARFTLPDASA
ncbi:MAG: hypothetical protein QOF71_1399 [Candidatus Eremiobacteraeota bacterium]|jgi:hypothetical protein|nr:hypothetical protein [Candidatus Eremiobacteraeota bacterium]